LAGWETAAGLAVSILVERGGILRDADDVEAKFVPALKERVVAVIVVSRVFDAHASADRVEVALEGRSEEEREAVLFGPLPADIALCLADVSCGSRTYGYEEIYLERGSPVYDAAPAKGAARQERDSSRDGGAEAAILVELFSCFVFGEGEVLRLDPAEGSQ